MKNDEARQKLIQAAGQVFAEVGYDAATVRQITDRAEVNVASINYHFGDKLNLYREVLSETFSQRTQLLGQLCSTGSAKERLYRFIEWMVAEEKDESRPWHRILVMREISDSCVIESSGVAGGADSPESSNTFVDPERSDTVIHWRKRIWRS